MIDGIFESLTAALYENYWIAVLASFGWGILSILLSPCHLTSIPLIVGYISSQGKISFRRTFYISLVFAAGILITIALIGIITASMGRLMGDVGVIGNYIVAALFFIVALNLLDLIKLPWNEIGLKGTSKKGLTAALVLGLIFGIGLGPCTFAFMAPVLGIVFQQSQTSLYSGLLLLFSFGLGHCFIIAGAGAMTKKVQNYLNWTENTKAVVWIKRVCAVLVMLGGIYLIFIIN